jgi:hypothetical protein
MLCGRSKKPGNIDTVLDAQQAPTADRTEQGVVGDTHGRDASVLAQRQFRNDRKVDAFQSRCIGGVKEAPMGRDNQCSAMEQLGQRKIVHKEINSVHVHNVGISDVSDYGQGNGIPERSEEGNPDDLDPCYIIALRQLVTSE